MKLGAQSVRWIFSIAAIACAATAADPNKILRVAANDIDTLDPQQYNDNPSSEVLISIFEPLYEWAYLESPPKLTPLTATAPIEIADGGKRWTMRVKPGIKGPDGKPLTITVTLRSGALSREIQTLWKKNMDAIGLRMDFHVTPFQDAIKEMQRARSDVRAAASGDIPPRERLCSAVAARLQLAGFFHLLEISRHRPRSAQVDHAATLAGRCGKPRKRALPSRTGTAVRA